MKIKKYSRGFTLVELLVVIAIIGMRAAVVLVSLASQRDKARRASAQQSVKSVMPAAMGCLAEGGYVYIASAGSSPAGDICRAASGGGATKPGFVGITWPNLATGSTSCTYPAVDTNATGTITVTCSAG